MCKWTECAPTQAGAMRDRDFDVCHGRSSDVHEVEHLSPKGRLEMICNVPLEFSAQADRLLADRSVEGHRTIDHRIAGIGGGLYVMIYEIVTFDTVSAAKSANALLAVYIGGAGGFYGPILGAIVVVLLQSGVSLLSNAWLLYVGVLFIVMVMYAPGGLIGSIYIHVPIWRVGRLRELLLPYLRAFPPALLVMLGFVLLVELASFTTIGAAQGKKFTIGGHTIDTTEPLPWVLALAALTLGALWLRREARSFRERWDKLIEDARQKGAM
jgi:branched-chain amino acid transport system permease protein